MKGYWEDAAEADSAIQASKAALVEEAGGLAEAIWSGLECPDYKDIAAAWSDALRRAAERLGMEYLLDGMPDGNYCPRAFDAWFCDFV